MCETVRRRSQRLLVRGAGLWGEGLGSPTPLRGSRDRPRSWAGAWARCVESNPAVRSGYTRRECVSTRPRRCPPRSAEARPDSGGPGAKWCRCSPPRDVAVALPGGWRPGSAEEGPWCATTACRVSQATLEDRESDEARGRPGSGESPAGAQQRPASGQGDAPLGLLRSSPPKKLCKQTWEGPPENFSPSQGSSM